MLGSTSKIALEALLDKDNIGLEAASVKQTILNDIKEKAATWSSKIIAFFSSNGKAFLTRITNLHNAFKSKLVAAKEKLSTFKNDADVYVKAHPYKTIAAALSACVAVVSIVAFTGRMLPSVTNTKAMTQFTTSVAKKINAINWPLGEVTAKVVSGGKKLAVGITLTGAAVGVAKLAQLGWSKVTAEQLDRSLEIVCNSVEKSWNILAPKVTSVSKGIWDFTKATASAAASGFSTGYNALINEREIPKEVSETSIIMDGVHLGAGVFSAAGTVLLFWASSILYGMYKLVSKIIGTTIALCARTISALAHPSSKEYV
jgi:ElaB/YqjD/DUF883 family membrane-anchored ribosome-binding protein